MRLGEDSYEVVRCMIVVADGFMVDYVMELL